MTLMLYEPGPPEALAVVQEAFGLDPQGQPRPPKVEEPPLICTYCTCALLPRGLVGLDFRCWKYAACRCPTGGCVPIQ